MPIAGDPKKTLFGACPQCGERAELLPDNHWRPFCSQRCKLLDLGEWFSGGYAVPAEDQGEGDATPPADATLQ